LIHEFLSRQFIAFLITGGTAAIINFGSRFVYNQWVSFSTAVILAYITGMITAFFLAKIFVFRESKQSIHHSAFFFCVVNALAVAQTWVISMVLAYYLLPYFGMIQYVQELAHAVGIAVPVFTSYIGHKRWSFR
jgi:putative flippase GtrA